MSEVFGAAYASTYDTVYAEKPYEAECDLLEAAFTRFTARPVKTVLDLGCGTGGHALPLARRGYAVTGVDRSPAMLARAAAKLTGEARPLDLTLVAGDVRTAALGHAFDAVVMMFAVLGYQLEDDDVLAALATARRHLEPGGVLVFDAWYGPAVLAQRPSPRVRVIATGNERLEREASGELDTTRRVCTVRFHLRRLVSDHVAEESHEAHTMRYFFPDELASLLGRAGLELAHLSAFPTLDRPADERSWNVLGVALAP